MHETSPGWSASGGRCAFRGLRSCEHNGGLFVFVGCWSLGGWTWWIPGSGRERQFADVCSYPSLKMATLKIKDDIATSGIRWLAGLLLSSYARDLSAPENTSLERRHADKHKLTVHSWVSATQLRPPFSSPSPTFIMFLFYGPIFSLRRIEVHIKPCREA